MAYLGRNAGKWIVVLCQVGTLAGCGGSAEESDSDSDDGAGASSGSTGSGSSAGTGSGGGTLGTGGGTLGTGGAAAGSGGLVDVLIECGDVAYPVAVVDVRGAPTDGEMCLISMEVSGFDLPLDISCLAVGTTCSCLMWSGNLVEGDNTITILDEMGNVNATYSGPYVAAEPSGACGGIFYEGVTIDYIAGAGGAPGGDQVSCMLSGVQEYCAVGETCCTCGCDVPSDSCHYENVCPPQAGPSCGDAQCRAGTICCDAQLGFCAATQTDCPQ